MSENGNTPPPVYLDPMNQAFAAEINSSGPLLQDLTPAQFRKLYDQLQQHTSIAGVDVTEIKVPFGSKAQDAIRTFIFRAEDATGDLPVIFWFHGGAWVAGNNFDNDSMSREIALHSGCAIVFPEYSLAPEKQFPVQQDECLAVVKYIAKHGQGLGLRTDKFGIAGDSAGGQLSPAVINLIHEQDLQATIPIVQQVLFSPATNLTDVFLDPTHSDIVFFNGPLLTVPGVKKFIPDYIPNPKDRESFLASALFMNIAQASRQPPTMIVVSADDPLRSEGEQFAKLLQRAGVKCGFVRAEAQMHDSAVLEATRNSPTAHAMVLMAAALFNEALMPVAATATGGKKRKSLDHGTNGNGDVHHKVEAQVQERLMKRTKKRRHY